MPVSVVIVLSYAWGTKPPFYGQAGNEDGTKDHPDPDCFYLLIMQRVLGHMFNCVEYKRAVDQIAVFWVRARPAPPFPSFAFFRRGRRAGLDGFVSELFGRHHQAGDAHRRAGEEVRSVHAFDASVVRQPAHAHLDDDEDARVLRARVQRTRLVR